MILRHTKTWRESLESLAASEPAAEPCPTPDAIWATVDGEADRETRIEVLEHTVRCAVCAETWRIARGMIRAKDTPVAVDPHDTEARFRGSRPEPRLEETVPFPDRRAALTSPPETRFGGLAIAASLAVAALGLTSVGWWWLGGGLSTDPAGVEYRQGAGGPVEIATAEGAVVSSQGFPLRWRGPEGARYRVVVATEALDEVWRIGGVEGNETHVPAEALVELPVGILLLWTLEVTTVEGGILSLPTQTLVLGDESGIDTEAPNPESEASPTSEETEANNG